MSSPQVFAIEMKLRADEIERAVNRIVIEASQAIAKEVIALTPVDSGAAISNWQAALGSPANGTLPAISPGEYGSTESANTSAAQIKAWSRIRGRRTGQDVWISNNLPYINDLNVGNIEPRSSPAPNRTPYPRFAERALNFGVLSVTQNKRKIFK